MVQKFQVLHVKCGGCANTLRKELSEDFEDVDVDLSTEPREISLDIDESRIEELKLKLRSIGYPLATDDLSLLEELSTTAKSYVSCAIGKID